MKSPQDTRINSDRFNRFTPPRKENRLVGWRYGVFIGLFVGFIGALCYPTVLKPMFDKETKERNKYLQRVNRAGMIKEDIQPGGMRVWTDPFAKFRSKPQEKESSESEK